MAPYSIPVRVYYQDTDAGGVVFHAQYLSFMERARCELLNAAGLDIARFAAEHGVLFVVNRLTAHYRAPARLNEIVSVTAQVVRIGHVSLDFEQRVERDGEVLVAAQVRLALVGREGMKPARMPAELRKLLEHA